jgi:hypothetical protein
MLERLLVAAGQRPVVGAEPIEDRPTLAELATAVDLRAQRLTIDWTRLRRPSTPDRLVEAIADPTARTGSARDAILAAFADEVADLYGLDRPRWTRAVGAPSEPWSAPGTPRMRAAAATSTPEPFRRRNLVLARSALFRPAA